MNKEEILSELKSDAPIRSKLSLIHWLVIKELLSAQALREFMIACVTELKPYNPNPNLLWETREWRSANEEALACYHASLLAEYLDLPDCFHSDKKHIKEFQLCLFASAEPRCSWRKVSDFHAELTPLYNEMDKDAPWTYGGYEFQVAKLIELIQGIG